MRTCPPDHLEYASRMLADNAVVLHRLINPHCSGYHAFPCGDHFHTGHNKASQADACKADPEHQELKIRTMSRGRRTKVRG